MLTPVVVGVLGTKVEVSTSYLGCEASLGIRDPHVDLEDLKEGQSTCTEKYLSFSFTNSGPNTARPWSVMGCL